MMRGLLSPGQRPRERASFSMPATQRFGQVRCYPAKRLYGLRNRRGSSLADAQGQRP